MTFEEWVETVPETIRNDALWRMEVYRLALFAQHLVWFDALRLAENRTSRSVADQLYRAVGSIGANIAEGYSRNSKRDQARFYEYALGSAREARHWYFGVFPVLKRDIIDHRLVVLQQIIRSLMAIVARYHSIHESSMDYATEPESRIIANPNVSDESHQNM